MTVLTAHEREQIVEQGREYTELSDEEQYYIHQVIGECRHISHIELDDVITIYSELEHTIDPCALNALPPSFRVTSVRRSTIHLGPSLTIEVYYDG